MRVNMFHPDLLVAVLGRPPVASCDLFEQDKFTLEAMRQPQLRDVVDVQRHEWLAVSKHPPEIAGVRRMQQPMQRWHDQSLAHRPRSSASNWTAPTATPVSSHPAINDTTTVIAR